MYIYIYKKNKKRRRIVSRRRRDPFGFLNILEFLRARRRCFDRPKFKERAHEQQ
jgi:hypothetical protein